ncbi:hypothetical protein ACWC3Y_16520 [Streptomyces sp. NPDC001296]
MAGPSAKDTFSRTGPGRTGARVLDALVAVDHLDDVAVLVIRHVAE